MHCSLHLEHNPCCVTQGAGEAFAVGTYTLEAGSGCRSGSLHFLSCDGEAFTEAGALLLAGVFDARWGAAQRVACACSDGKLVLCSAPAAAPAAVLCEAQCSAQMCTSADWLSDSELVTCGQDGSAQVVQLREARSLPAGFSRTSRRRQGLRLGALLLDRALAGGLGGARQPLLRARGLLGRRRLILQVVR